MAARHDKSHAGRGSDAVRQWIRSQRHDGLLEAEREPRAGGVNAETAGGGGGSTISALGACERAHADGGNDRADALVQWGKGDGPHARLRNNGGEGDNRHGAAAKWVALQQSEISRAVEAAAGD